MSGRPRFSLRARLLAVALLAVVPVVLGLTVAHRQIVRAAEEERTGTVRELARIAAREHRAALVETQTILRMLGSTATGSGGLEAACAQLPIAHEGHPFYSALALYRADGTTICRHPEGEAYDLSEVEYFVRAVSNGEPAINDYHLTPDSVARASLAVPITVGGGIDVVAVAGIDLARVRTLQETVVAEPGLTLLALEADGTVLVELPGRAGAVGARAHPGITAALASGRDTIAEAPDATGRLRRFAIRSLGDEEPGLETWVAVGYEVTSVRGGLLPGAFASLLGLIAGGLVMLGGIWLVLEYGLLHRLAPVLEAAHDLGRGRLDARSGVRGEDEVGVIGASFDAMADRLERTHRAEAEAARRAIQDRDDRLRLITETIDEAFWIWDVGRAETVYTSPGFTTIWGRPAHEVLDERGSWRGTVHPDDLGQLAETPTLGSREYRILRPDGEVRWIRNRTFAVRDADGTVVRYVGTAQDITDRRTLEEALAQTSKLEAVGRLAGGVAHDFNNILMAVRGHVQLLQDSAPPGSELHADLGEIDRAAVRAEHLTRQLLAFGRRQPLSVRTVDLDEAILDMRDLLRRVVGAPVKLVVESDPATPTVRMDPTHLEQILVNLAVNARDAMPNGGRLTIRTGSAHLPDDAPELAEHAEPGEYARLEVSDEGTGMEPEVLAHVFEPFFTTKATGKGTGLGLATIYGITTQAGGHIRVWSEPGLGARFTIFLPAEGTSAEQGPTARTAAPLTEGASGHRILLVEDEAAVLTVARRTLEALGHEVFTADGGAAALDLLDHESVDLLITDMIMPDMTGAELVRTLRGMGSELPVIYMTGYPGDALVDELAGVPLLQKPFTRSELVRAITEVMTASR